MGEDVFVYGKPGRIKRRSLEHPMLSICHEFADAHPGHTVFDENGLQVYPERQKIQY